jgi:hypothetical protein
MNTWRCEATEDKSMEGWKQEVFVGWRWYRATQTPLAKTQAHGTPNCKEAWEM